MAGVLLGAAIMVVGITLGVALTVLLIGMGQVRGR